MIGKIKSYILGGAAIGLIILGVLIGRAFRKPESLQETVYSRVESIQHMKRLELVTYHFESMVDVTHPEKKDKVYLLMVIPARVSCYIDLEQVRLTVNDTLIRIRIPEPVIEPPVLDLDSAKLFNMNQRYITASKKSYETVVRNVQRSLIRAKEDALNRARANGIVEETGQLGKGYFRGLFSELGYRIEFEEPHTN